MIGSAFVHTALGRCLSRAAAPGPRGRARLTRLRELAETRKQAPDRELARQFAAIRDPRAMHHSGGSPDFAVRGGALVFEAVRRVLQVDLYDEQLLAGLALDGGAVVEMQTGEGKTLAAVLPACLQALQGPVHVMTDNAYLAHRDHALLQPVFQRLGLAAGVLQPDQDSTQRAAARNARITYGSAADFGFDYLRGRSAPMRSAAARPGDRWRRRIRSDDRFEETCTGPLAAAAIVDEADSVLIDQASMPLILSPDSPQPSRQPETYRRAAEVAGCLRESVDYRIESCGRLSLTGEGLARLRSKRLDAPAGRLQRAWSAYVENALHASRLMRPDVDYVVDDGRVLYIDQQTGRISEQRIWSDGLQQALQAKEGVTITSETQSVARIHRQRHLQLYRHLCGMTGTAQGAARELSHVYGLAVVAIPTHRPCRRQTLIPRVFGNRETKEAAIVADVARRHRQGRPVLVGTASIEASLRLAGLLSTGGVPHQLLNGKQDAREAAIVAGAGQVAAVTITTNMAGRGTDIHLAAGVAEQGGLHVIACEPQDSQRLDRQLAGRAARQGDPGSWQLFASAEDALFQQHAPAFARRMRRLAGSAGEVAADLAAPIAAIQRRAERHTARQRRAMADHDDWRLNTLRHL